MKDSEILSEEILEKINNSEKLTLKEECFVRNYSLGFEFPEFDKTTIANHWEEFGGSFFKGLSIALRSADFDNERLIRSNWQHKIKQDYDILLTNENNAWKN